jgi:CheY-like chemotaxis protein/pSer/pThr/pTyr-binding forkhead associated (FHA) protein
MIRQLDTTASIPWVIDLHAPHLVSPLRVFIRDRAMVGRSIPGESAPDVDLGAAETEEHPVSCEHLMVYREGDGLMVMDMESEGGTSLNDQSLPPYTGKSLHHGDQLCLGRLQLHVDVILSPNKGGAMHYQSSLNLHDRTQPGKDQWILIVEDDSRFAQVLADIMHEAGYTTKIARDVVGAMRAFSQSQPNAVILDLNLPDMDGLEFCRYVRRDVLHNTIPILAINSSSYSGDANDALRAGADMLMEKPLNASDLRDVMVGLVNQHENSTHAIRTRRLAHETPFNVFPQETRRQNAILFVAGCENEPIILNGQKSVSFGRKSGTGSIGSHTHVDLTRYNAANYGVSRVHMFLHQEDGEFYIEDVGSRNHTYINGEMVCPFEHTPVENGDEIRLGHLRMYIYFIMDGVD